MTDTVAVIPFQVVQVIVAFHSHLAVTNQSEDTVATQESFVLHDTDLSSAPLGDTVAVNCCVLQIVVRVTGDGDILTEVGTIISTVTDIVSVFQFTVVAVIVAVQFQTAVINHVASTDTIVVSLDVHVTLLSIAVLGSTTATNCSVSQVHVNVTLDGVTVTLLGYF